MAHVQPHEKAARSLHATHVHIMRLVLRVQDLKKGVTQDCLKLKNEHMNE